MFVGPALLLLGVFLVYPIIDTTWTSLTVDVEGGFGLDNYEWAFTDESLHVAYRNNVLWLIFGTGGSVCLGMFVAVMVDKIRREALAKTFIFLPLAISFVGASVIWKFVYAWRPPGQPQIGITNATIEALGGEPMAFLIERPINTFALIFIMVWLQTGFAMVIFSAALKNVPTEVIEAARLDGANEFQLFFRVVLPMIKGTVITVGTTIFIAVLKVFDIVFVMTGGRFDTEVIANRMFKEMFTFRNFGHASTLAVLLLVVVTPVMVLNVRNLRRQGLGQ
ncbi:MAG: sugar ABC transporter permease [Acidimicrobiia bacterium]|nr:sugar ABC transporter permease [Acidimicrobiia bacterium]